MNLTLEGLNQVREELELVKRASTEWNAETLPRVEGPRPRGGCLARHAARLHRHTNRYVPAVLAAVTVLAMASGASGQRIVEGPEHRNSAPPYVLCLLYAPDSALCPLLVWDTNYDGQLSCPELAADSTVAHPVTAAQSYLEADFDPRSCPDLITSASASTDPEPEPEARQVTADTTRSPPRQTRACCRVCRTGKACGNSCIARNRTCRQPRGCACNGEEATLTCRSQSHTFAEVPSARLEPVALAFGRARALSPILKLRGSLRPLRDGNPVGAFSRKERFWFRPSTALETAT